MINIGNRESEYSFIALSVLILKIRKEKILSVLLLASALFAFSCSRKPGKIKSLDIQSLPTTTVVNDRTVYTDSGKVQLILTFPIMEEFEKKDNPYSEFRSGIRVDFYDGHEAPRGNVTSKYARYDMKKKIWELKDSVVVINETNDKLETEQLFWDQQKDLIYTDRFVKITNEDQIVMGSGFESDTRLTKRKITNYNATIYLKDE